MKVLSLFSGVGGFDMGLENAGMETVFQCEWDKHCRTILDRHWPTVPKWDDVSTLTGEHILAHAPVIDVVAWGSPCQDLSVAGKRAGLEGGRSGLFYEGMRIINELRKASNGKYPRISIWENVYGALNSNKGEDFEAILKEMVEAGSLLCEWRVLDAQYFGVPQRRRRVFVIAVFDPAIAERCPDPLLPLEEGVRGDTASSAATRQDAATEIAGCLRGGGSGGVPSSRGEHLVVESFMSSSHAQYTEGVGTLRANGGDLSGGSETLLVEPIGIQGNVIGCQDHNGPAGKGHTEEGEPMFTLNTTDRHAVATPIGFSHTQGLSAQPSEQTFPTLRREGSGMAVAEPTMSVRRLTPLECERLMGWPDDWTAGQADTHRYKQCGNGVASPVAQWIGEQIINL